MTNLIGQSVKRVEDKRFLTGKGRYVDDMVLPNMTWAHIVRSDVAHAVIKGVDIDAASLDDEGDAMARAADADITRGILTASPGMMEIALPIGIYSAVRQHKVEDYAITFVGFLGLAVPDFLLALWLLWATFVYFPDHSIGGLFSPEYIEAPWSLARVKDLFSHLWIAAFVVGTAGTAAKEGSRRPARSPEHQRGFPSE